MRMEIVFTRDIIPLYNEINGGTEMTELKSRLERIDIRPNRLVREVNEEVAEILKELNYEIDLFDYNRPWGGFTQLSNQNADRFVSQFFPELTPEAARLGNPLSELSPKILVVAPNQRLSWQYHNRRAERWVYITDGGYFKSTNDNQGDLIEAKAKDTIQFSKGERHRLVGSAKGFTLVAEIWQHTEVNDLSNEEDIIRLEDDYKR